MNVSELVAEPHQGPGRDKLVSYLLAVIGIALVAAVAVALTARFGLLSRKAQVLGVMGLSIPIVAYITRRPKEVFLFAYVFALTYNRQYFSFNSIFGSHGSQGPYWVPADVFLVGLAVLWALDKVFWKESRAPLGRSLWPWYLPFAFICLISAFVAVRPDWTLFEMIRVGKVMFIFAYFRYNVTALSWWVIVAGMGCAILAQATLGTIEVATGRSGVLWMVGMSSQIQDYGAYEGVQAGFDPLSFYGFTRATATMNHPPNLACYFLQTVPIFLALALSFPNRAAQTVFAVVAGAGAVGLAVTLSRWPWALALAQVSALIVGLVAFKVVPARRALGLVAVGSFAFVLALIPLRHRIIDRFTRDFGPSVEARLHSNRITVEMFKDRPFLGVGLNNSRAHIENYDQTVGWAFVDDEFLPQQMNVRAIIAQENGFSVPLVETGVVGLAAFLLYLGGALLTGVRAIVQTDGYVRAATMGLFIGILGLLGQQFVDFSIWVDPLLYTFTLMVAMLANAPYVLEPGAKRIRAAIGRKQ